jgi:hypothetical protein
MSAQETGPSGTPVASDESTLNDSSDDGPVERSLIPTDDDSQNIAIFWGWNDRAFFSSLISTPLLAGIWYGWIWWILHRHPSGSTIWWTVYVGIIVVVLSLCAWRRIIVFIASVVAAPFVVVHSCYVFFLARYFVVSTNWFRRHPSGPQNCKLCSKCDRLVSNSSLLVGAPWVLVRPSEIHHFYFLPDLRVSSETCHLCSLFWHSLKSIDRSSITHPTQPLAAAKKAQKPSDISLSEGMRIGPKEMSTSPSLPKAIYKLQPIQKVERQGDTYLRVKIWKQSHCLRKSVLRMQICGDPISTSEVLKVENARASNDPVRHKCYQSQRTDSKDIIAWAKVLIDQCSEGHELCKARFVADESRSYLPLRLLDVGGSQGDPIKLINGAELKAELVTYLALSHCWGGPIDAKLYKGNLEDMKTTGVKTLPCNFREAIIVTRGLGERYLWIDSLCIVQDDDQEWEEQSINMGLVYANAKCVLSAAASGNSNGGCFRPRDLFRSDCVLRRRWNRALVVRSQERSDLVRLFKRKIESAPLTKRGWTFQERYLASRILHFGSGVVLFECNKLIASDHDQGKIGQEYSVRQVIRSDGRLHAAEDIDWARRDIRKTKVVRKTVKVATGRNSYKSEMRDVTVMNPDYPRQQATKARLRNDSARLGMRGTFDFLWRYNGTNFAEQIEFHNSWYEMIEHYSSRNLSRSGDKLMAISGVAYFIQQNTNLKYCRLQDQDQMKCRDK